MASADRPEGPAISVEGTPYGFIHLVGIATDVRPDQRPDLRRRDIHGCNRLCDDPRSQASPPRMGRRDHPRTHQQDRYTVSGHDGEGDTPGGGHRGIRVRCGVRRGRHGHHAVPVHLIQPLHARNALAAQACQQFVPMGGHTFVPIARMQPHIEPTKLLTGEATTTRDDRDAGAGARIW